MSTFDPAEYVGGVRGYFELQNGRPMSDLELYKQSLRDRRDGLLTSEDQKVLKDWLKEHGIDTTALALSMVTYF